jgi:hypothetical protein
MKIYPPLINLINSPWENIREIIIQIIIEFFANGLVIKNLLFRSNTGKTFN